jgi:aryl-alcohol dehydrogenase-like predicted oxidoreductase
MQYVRLGSTGLKVSRICLGMMTFGSPEWRPWVMDEATSRPLVQHAVDLGINFFDTADTYSAGESEVLTGKFLKAMFPNGRREEAVVATKVFNPVHLGFEGTLAAAATFARRPNMDGLSRKRIFHAVDASLKRLGTDYIDLYQIHRFDKDTPLEETMEALHDVVKAGKVRYIGASSMWAWQFAKAQQVAKEHGWTRFVSMQNHYNLVYREEEREMIPLCKDSGVALLPWSPLARGFLAGNRKVGENDQTPRAKADDTARKYYYRECDFKVVESLGKLAQEKGVSSATLAYAWLLHKGVTAPIVGASKIGQLDQAVDAIDVTMTEDDVQRLEAAYEPHPVLGHV